jgi:hypothetical protein
MDDTSVSRTEDEGRDSREAHEHSCEGSTAGSENIRGPVDAPKCWTWQPTPEAFTSDSAFA